MRRPIATLLPGLAAALSICGAAAGTPSLDVGDPAPQFQPLQWVKGPPVSELKKGRVYVVEFWATWCIGCIQAMPHFSELARKYRDMVTFISVHSETEPGFKRDLAPYVASIKKFVDKKGNDLDCAVAIDDPVQSPIHRDWVKAAGFAGVPHTFIVDGEGKIAWIDGPLSLDEALAQLLAGTLKIERRARDAQEEAFLKEWSQQMGPTEAALARKDYEVAVIEADKAIASGSKWGTSNVMLEYRLKALLHVDEKRGLAYAQELLDGKKLPDVPDHPKGGDGAFRQAGYAIVSQDGLSMEAYRVAVGYLKRAVKQYPHSVHGWHGLALAYGRVGDPVRAEQAIQKVIEAVDRVGMSGETEGTTIREELKHMVRGRE